MNRLELSTTAAGSDLVLAELLDEISMKVKAGESICRDSYLARYPEHAAELGELLDAVLLAAAFGQGEHEVDFGGGLSDVLVDGTLGDFRILREVGRGGMGIVYEAEQISLRRRVALKILPFAAVLDPRHLQRFKNEAVAAASLGHPNIVEVFGVGCERGVHFYAMRYVEGQTLAAVIEQLRSHLPPREETSIASSRLAPESSFQSPAPSFRPASSPSILDPKSFPPAADTLAAALSTLRESKPQDYYRRIAELGIQAAEALDHAHQMGIVHRDIKPANLLVESSHLAPRDETSRASVLRPPSSSSISDPRPSPLRLYVSDFGLARIGADPTLTLTGDLVGTLRYMSPEQAAGDTVIDQRSDIYSLGITLCELLTLQSAFPASDRQTLLRQIINDEPPEPRSLNKAVPADLETIVLKAIAKEPALRYRAARDFADDLRRFIDHQPVRARRITPMGRLFRFARRHRVSLSASAVTLFIAWIIAFALLLGEKQKTSAALAQSKEDNQQLVEEQQRAKRNLRLAQDSFSTLLREVGHSLAGAGRFFEAQIVGHRVLSVYDDWLKESPNDIDLQIAAAVAHLQAAELFLLIDQPGKAHERPIKEGLRLSQAIFEARPDDPQAAQLLAAARNLSGEYLAAARKLPEARIEFQKATLLLGDSLKEPHEDPFIAQVLANLGHVDLLEGRLEAAELAYRKALRYTSLPDRPLDATAILTSEDQFVQAVAAHNLAALLVRKGDWAEARRFIHAAERYHFWLKLERGGTERYNEFRRRTYALERSILTGLREHASVFQIVNNDLKQSNERVADIDAIEALPALIDCVRLADGQPPEKRDPAVTQQYRERIRELLNVLAKQAETDTVLHDGLAWHLANFPLAELRAPDTAITLATQATKTSPERGESWNTLGVAHYRAGHWADAARMLEKSASLRNGGDAFDWYPLAMAYWKLERKAEAEQALAKAETSFAELTAAQAGLRALREEARAIIRASDSSEPTKTAVAITPPNDFCGEHSLALLRAGSAAPEFCFPFAADPHNKAPKQTARFLTPLSEYESSISPAAAANRAVEPAELPK